MSRIITITKTGDTVTLFSPRVDAVLKAEDIGNDEVRVVTNTDLRMTVEEKQDEKALAQLKSRTRQLVGGVTELAYDLWDSFNDFEVVVNIDNKAINVMNEKFVAEWNNGKTKVKPANKYSQDDIESILGRISKGFTILKQVSGFIEVK